MVKYNRLVCCFRKGVWGVNMLNQSHQKQQEHVAVLTFLADRELSMIQFVLKSEQIRDSVLVLLQNRLAGCDSVLQSQKQQKAPRPLTFLGDWELSKIQFALITRGTDLPSLADTFLVS